MSIAAFDIIDTSPYLDKILNLNPSEPMSGNFATVGFESLYVLHNLGSFLIVLLVLIAEIIVSLMMMKLCSPECKYWGKKLYDSIFCGQIISLLFESYSVLTMSCFINIRNLSWDSPGEKI